MQVIRIIARVSCKVHKVSNYSDSPLSLSPWHLLLGILYGSFDAATDCGHIGASTGFSCHLATSAAHRESQHQQLPLCALGLVSQSTAHATQRWQRAAGYTHSEQWRIGKRLVTCILALLRDSMPTPSSAHGGNYSVHAYLQLRSCGLLPGRKLSMWITLSAASRFVSSQSRPGQLRCLSLAGGAVDYGRCVYRWRSSDHGATCAHRRPQGVQSGVSP